MGVICNFIIWGLVALCVEAVPALWCTALLPCSGGNEAGRKCGLLYRVSQEECARLQDGVSYVKVYRYNPKHLCSKLNG